MRKSDLVIEDLAEDLKLLPWQSLQGIKDDRLLIFVLSRVVAKEFNLDEMVTKFQKQVFFYYDRFFFEWLLHLL